MTPDAPLSEEQLQDCLDRFRADGSCEHEIVESYRALAEQVKRDEEHYQALSAMNEKHRKNWVEASQSLADAQARYDELLQKWNEGYTAQVEQQHAALRERLTKWEAWAHTQIADIDKFEEYGHALGKLKWIRAFLQEALATGAEVPRSSSSPCGHRDCNGDHT